MINDGLQQGDLVGIPARLQFALQGDGWIIRNDCVWHKLNPMPESVAGWRWERHKVKTGRTAADWSKLPKGWDVGIGSHDSGTVLGNYRKEGEREATTPVWSPCPGCEKCAPNGGHVLRRGSWRHTRAHETVLMCTKQMGYFSNQETVREPLAEATIDREMTGYNMAFANQFRGSPTDKRHPNGKQLAQVSNPSGRNPRSVLSVSSEPYSGAHYAVFPTALIAPLIRATCPAQCCPVCGAGYAPVVEREHTTIPIDERHGRVGHNGQPPQQSGWFWKEPKREFLGRRPTCDCAVGDSVPGIILDPFCGSGTTLQVARDLGLRAVGIDLSHTYLDSQAKIRANVGAPSDALSGLPLFDVEIDGEVQDRTAEF